NSGINLSESGSNSIVISTQANTPQNLEMLITPVANEYGSITMTATITDDFGNSNQFSFIIHCYIPIIETELNDPDGYQNHLFGTSVSVDGNLVAIGSRGYTDMNGNQVGAVHFYQGNTKDNLFALLNSNTQTLMGYDVTISKDDAVAISASSSKYIYAY
ncbi:hypothetical protein MHK_005945, partial [Candidatus Magnetomorum sp. HK-1]